MSDEISREELLVLTTEVVSSYVAHNSIATAEIPDVIAQVFKALSNVGGDSMTASDRPQPAVPIKRSITVDYLICLEDGKKLKMLKRHLKTAYNMTPEAYRERWGLPADYPMVAPSYAEKRSKLAKDIGLGTRN
ncbi:MAG: MucR family transcriptional regulator [Alphaproteobacteria bacterium]|nr:MAG: MucR family transcriptional regulator [Alphaproteobacteria bacterium]